MNTDASFPHVSAGMPFFKLEMSRCLPLWTGWSVLCALIVCLALLVYPDIASDPAGMKEMFASMGTLTDAFGLSSLDFGSYAGYFATEGGIVISLGLGLYASILGSSLASHEQSARTAEFLMSFPVGRTRIWLEKTLALLLLITSMFLFLALCSWAVTIGIDETFSASIWLLLVSCWITAICLGLFSMGLSSFFQEASTGWGLGLGLGSYFMVIAGQLSDSLGWLCSLTPYGICQTSWISQHDSLPPEPLLICTIMTLTVWLAGLHHYRKMDIS